MLTGMMRGRQQLVADEFGRFRRGYAAESGGRWRGVAATAGRGHRLQVGCCQRAVCRDHCGPGPRHLGDLRPAEVLANRNELISGAMTPWRAYQSCVTGWSADALAVGAQRLRRLSGESPRRSEATLGMAPPVAIVFYVAALVFRDVASLENPCPAEGRQSPSTSPLKAVACPLVS